MEWYISFLDETLQGITFFSLVKTYVLDHIWFQLLFHMYSSLLHIWVNTNLTFLTTLLFIMFAMLMSGLLKVYTYHQVEYYFIAVSL